MLVSLAPSSLSVNKVEMPTDMGQHHEIPCKCDAGAGALTPHRPERCRETREGGHVPTAFEPRAQIPDANRTWRAGFLQEKRLHSSCQLNHSGGGLDYRGEGFATLTGKHVGDTSVCGRCSCPRGLPQACGRARPARRAPPFPPRQRQAEPRPPAQAASAPQRPGVERGGRESGSQAGGLRGVEAGQLRLPLRWARRRSSFSSSPRPGRAEVAPSRARRAWCQAPLRHAGRLPAGAAGGAVPGAAEPSGGVGPPGRQHQLVPGGRRFRCEAAAAAAAGQRGGQGDGERRDGKGLLRAGGGPGRRQPWLGFACV